jgi:hypothetical protein
MEGGAAEPPSNLCGVTSCCSSSWFPLSERGTAVTAAVVRLFVVAQPARTAGGALAADLLLPCAVTAITPQCLRAPLKKR